MHAVRVVGRCPPGSDRAMVVEQVRAGERWEVLANAFGVASDPDDVAIAILDLVPDLPAAPSEARNLARAVTRAGAADLFTDGHGSVHELLGYREFPAAPRGTGLIGGPAAADGREALGPAQRAPPRAPRSAAQLRLAPGARGSS